MTTNDVRCDRHQGVTFPPRCSDCIAANNQVSLERAHAEGGAAEAQRRFGTSPVLTATSEGQAEANRRFGQPVGGSAR